MTILVSCLLSPSACCDYFHYSKTLSDGFLEIYDRGTCTFDIFDLPVRTIICLVCLQGTQRGKPDAARHALENRHRTSSRV